MFFSNCTGRTAIHRRRVQDKHSRKHTVAFEDKLPQGNHMKEKNNNKHKHHHAITLRVSWSIRFNETVGGVNARESLKKKKKKEIASTKIKKRFPFYFYFPTGIVLVFHLASVNVARPDQVSPLTNNDMTLSACHCTQQIITTTLLSLSLKKKGKEDYGSGARKADRICCSDRDSSTSHGSFFYLLLRVLLPFPNLQQRTPNRRKTIVISSHHTTKCIVQES